MPSRYSGCCKGIWCFSQGNFEAHSSPRKTWEEQGDFPCSVSAVCLCATCHTECLPVFYFILLVIMPCRYSFYREGGSSEKFRNLLKITQLRATEAGFEWGSGATQPGSPPSSPGLQSPGRTLWEVSEARSSPVWNASGRAVSSSVSPQPAPASSGAHVSIRSKTGIHFYLAWHLSGLAYLVNCLGRTDNRQSYKWVTQCYNHP